MPHYYKGELIGTSRRYDERLTVALLKMINSGPVLMVHSEIPSAEADGRRFETLLAAIETDGEDARGRREDAFSRADSAAVSPWSDEELMAELRGFEDDR